MKWSINGLKGDEQGFFTYMALILGTVLLLFWSAIGETMHTLISMTHDEVGLTTMNYYAEGIIGCLLRTYSQKGDSMPQGREVIYEQTKQGKVTYILTSPSTFNKKGDFRITYRNIVTGQQVRYYVVFREQSVAANGAKRIYNERKHIVDRTENTYNNVSATTSMASNLVNETGDYKKIIVERVSRIQ